MNNTELVEKKTDLTDKMAFSVFIKDKKALYDKIERDKFESATPELNEQLLAIDARDYADLTNIAWLYNDGNWRKKREIDILRNAVVYKMSDKLAASNENDEVEKKNVTRSMIIGGFIGASLFFLIFSVAHWLMFSGVEFENKFLETIKDLTFMASAIYLTPITALPSLGILILVSTGMGTTFIGGVIYRFFCGNRKPMYYDVRKAQDLGIDLTDTSIANTLAPFLGVFENISTNTKTDKAATLIPNSLVLMFAIGFIVSFMIWFDTGPISAVLEKCGLYHRSFCWFNSSFGK